jgi:CBS domain-containing protein
VRVRRPRASGGTRHALDVRGLLAMEGAMKKTVKELMSRNVCVVRHWETLDQVARLMWEHDFGCVPVVDESTQLVGIITDRDVCMAAYTQGRRLDQIHIGSACTRTVYPVEPDTTLEAAETLMRTRRVRRLPVCDARGSVVGMLSLADLAVHLNARPDTAMADGLSSMSIAATVEAVSEPRSKRSNGGLAH